MPTPVFQLPLSLQSFASQCMAFVPAERPTFAQIDATLDKLLKTCTNSKAKSSKEAQHSSPKAEVVKQNRQQDW